MHSKIIFSTLLSGLLIAISGIGQTTKPIDRLGVEGPVNFDEVPFNLVWTSHPTAKYYKQEYLANGDKLENFHMVIMLEVIIGRLNLNDVVETKVAELRKMNIPNPVVNKETFIKNRELMLDFILSQKVADGKSMLIVERNVYRYKMVIDENAKEGVLLLALSDRYYGKEINVFFLQILK